MRIHKSMLAMTLALGLVGAACSSTSEDTTTTTPSQDDVTTTTVENMETTTTTEAPEDELKTGRGVDVASKTIKIGLLSDLTGLFSPLVIDVTDAQQVYWDKVNAEGGVDGWTVELVVEDTNYNVEQHLEKYEKIKDEVLALSLSTGSPTTVAALPQYVADSMLTIPLGWYSGWAIPAFDSGVVFEQNANYCFDTMNMVEFAMEQGGQKFALATFPGDYGQDTSAGAKHAFDYYDLELVYDGEAAVIPGQDLTDVIQGIASSGADWTILAASPGTAAEIMGGAAQGGYTGKFIGNNATYNFALLDSPVGPLVDASFYQSAFNVGWGQDLPGNNEMMAAMAEAYPDRRPSDVFILGWNQALAMHQVIAQALANKDITPEGMVAASTEVSIDFGGSQPAQSWAGTPNDYVVRATAIYNPDLALYTAAGGAGQTLSQEGATTGSVLERDFFISEAAKDYDFTAPCWEM
ncbi:MAG: ABC transporter substrate-binding protein [Acidimicrobiia bacterium]|nr:ABC transporter substrate-binding protein [Acidimicrobiia bacterium]